MFTNAILRATQQRFASSAQRGFINLASRSMARSPGLARTLHATRGQKLRDASIPTSYGGRGTYAQLTPFQKAATALGITGALTGMGFQYYRGMSMASGTAQAADARKQLLHPYPDHMRQRLDATYSYIINGLGLTAISGYACLRSGIAGRIAMMGPWATLGLSAVMTIAPMMACQMTDDDASPALKVGLWGASMAGMGAVLSPLGFMGGPLLIQAAAGTGIMVGSIALAAKSAPSESFLWMSGPLNIGLGVVLISSIGTMFFPANPALVNVAMYGGLGLFGAFVLYDTQKLHYKAEHAAVYSPINESYSLYLDTINIFVRIAYILGMQNGRRRK